MRSPVGGFDPAGVETIAGQIVQSPSGEWPGRREKGEKDFTVATDGPDVLDIAQHGIANSGDERVGLRAVPFGSLDPQQVMFPIEVVEAEVGDLTHAQAIDGKQHQHGAIPNITWLVGIEAREQALHIRPGRPEREWLKSEATGALNGRG